jgi:hypothetical protein
LGLPTSTSRPAEQDGRDGGVSLLGQPVARLFRIAAYAQEVMDDDDSRPRPGARGCGQVGRQLIQTSGRFHLRHQDTP